MNRNQILSISWTPGQILKIFYMLFCIHHIEMTCKARFHYHLSKVKVIADCKRSHVKIWCMLHISWNAHLILLIFLIHVHLIYTSVIQLTGALQKNQCKTAGHSRKDQKLVFKTNYCLQGFFQQFWEKAPRQNWEKMIDLTSKLGEIKGIEDNKGNKIYPQNQVILDSIMSSIPLKHKCLSMHHSDMGHCFSY